MSGHGRETELLVVGGRVGKANPILRGVEHFELDVTLRMLERQAERHRTGCRGRHAVEVEVLGRVDREIGVGVVFGRGKDAGVGECVVRLEVIGQSCRRRRCAVS